MVAAVVLRELEVLDILLEVSHMEELEVLDLHTPPLDSQLAAVVAVVQDIQLV